MCSGLMKYTKDCGSIDVPHAFVVVKDEHDFFLLDNNIEGSAVIDSKTPLLITLLRMKMGMPF